MGSGKGSPEYWVAVIKPGRVMFEMAGVNEDIAKEALRLAMHKLPVKCKFVKKGDIVSADAADDATGALETASADKENRASAAKEIAEVSEQ
jgi:hypothetical protein